MSYYKPCPELDECRRLIREFFETEQYEKCFQGYCPLAEKGYPLAECQVGYFYMEGLGVEKDEEKALYWTKRAAEHGDRDGQYNLAECCRKGVGTEPDIEQAKYWYLRAAKQDHDLAIEKCEELHVKIE